MSLPEFEYKGLMGQAWDLLRGDTSQWEDRFFFLDVIRKYGQPVLDVGCSTGRLLLVIEMDLVHQAMKRFYAHLEPGGVLVAPFMRLWQAGEPLESEWEVSRTRPQDGATIRRVARSRYDPEIECEHTEDLYQVIQEGVVLEEELHRRSPATRSYTQEQARRLFEKAGFREVELYSGFSFDPVKSDDGLFTVIGRRTAV